jgi:tol-pal system protein YbgF
MRKLLPLVVLLTACASGGGDEPQPSPSPSQVAAPARDAQLAELQTSMTELLERLDVLNDRITRVETAQETRAAAPSATPLSGAPRVSRGETRTETRIENPGGGTPAAPQRQAAVASAAIAEAYGNALVLYGKNRPAEARAAFQRVLASDPTGELADNALYWIGETYFAANDFGNAMTYYRRVSDEFANENKAPDALYKLGVAQARTGDLMLARTTLQQVITRYPYSQPATQAKAELNRIKY